MAPHLIIVAARGEDVQGLNVEPNGFTDARHSQREGLAKEAQRGKFVCDATLLALTHSLEQTVKRGCDCGLLHGPKVGVHPCASRLAYLGLLDLT